MHQGTLIDELIQSVERAEAQTESAVVDMVEPAELGSGLVYELPRPEPMVGVA